MRRMSTALIVYSVIEKRTTPIRFDGFQSIVLALSFNVAACQPDVYNRATHHVGGISRMHHFNYVRLQEYIDMFLELILWALSLILGDRFILFIRLLDIFYRVITSNYTTMNSTFIWK